jgi:Ran GTPase-activating protein (RanGAP) involved in mRNA processing and transport
LSFSSFGLLFLLSHFLDKLQSLKALIIPCFPPSLFPSALYYHTMSTIVEKSNTKISFKELADLVQPETVEQVILTDVHISGDEDDEFFFGRAVRGHPELQSMTLKNITLDEGMTLDNVVEMMLISCHELKNMTLDNVPVRAKSCSTLVYCETLEHLALPNNGFNDVDAKLVADSVESNESVISVDLSGNKISDVGCKSLRHCLEKNKTLQKICLDGNSVSGAESAKLDSTLQTRIAMAA